jgi:hypothetical protein
MVCSLVVGIVMVGVMWRIVAYPKPQPVIAETTRVYDTTRAVRVLSYRFVNGVLKDSTTIMLPDSLSVRGTQRRNAGRTP